MTPGKRKQNIVDECNWGRRAFNIEENASGWHCASGNDGASETDWLEFVVDAAVGIQRSPAGWVLKKADAADLLIRAEIEPMQDAPRDSNQIPGFHFDGDNRRRLRIHVKEAPALHNESHFVFVMPVFP